MKFCPPLAVNATFVTLTKCKLLLKKMWLKRPYLSNFARFCTKMHVGNLHKILSTHQCEWPVFKRTLPVTLQEISQLDILCNTKQTQKKINNWWPAAIYWNKTSRNKSKKSVAWRHCNATLKNISNKLCSHLYLQHHIWLFHLQV